MDRWRRKTIEDGIQAKGVRMNGNSFPAEMPHKDCVPCIILVVAVPMELWLRVG